MFLKNNGGYNICVGFTSFTAGYYKRTLHFFYMQKCIFYNYYNFLDFRTRIFYITIHDL